MRTRSFNVNFWTFCTFWPTLCEKWSKQNKLMLFSWRERHILLLQQKVYKGKYHLGPLNTHKSSKTLVGLWFKSKGRGSSGSQTWCGTVAPSPLQLQAIDWLFWLVGWTSGMWRFTKPASLIYNKKGLFGISNLLLPMVCHPAIPLLRQGSATFSTCCNLSVWDCKVEMVLCFK